MVNSTNVENFLESLYKQAKPKYEFQARNLEEWKVWKAGLTTSLLNRLGHIGDKDFPLNPVILEREEFHDYIRERVEFTTVYGLRMPAYVLIPAHHRGEHRAVVAWHGHGYGSREIIGLNPDGTSNSGDPGLHKNFALNLVERGFLVIAPDMLGMGDRILPEDRNDNPKTNSCQRLSTYLVMFGLTLAGLRVYEAKRVVDYLTSRSDVDASRIGCMGISGGGLICALSSAIDDRIQASVVSCYANTFYDSILARQHCADNYIPGMLADAEMPDLIALIAPKALLIECGMHDSVFPPVGASKCASKLHEVYTLIEQSERFFVDEFNGGHEISGRHAYNWLDKWL